MKRWLWLAVVLLLVVPVLPQTQAQSDAEVYYPSEEWRTDTPESQGIDAGQLADLVHLIREENHAVDSITIIRNGTMVMDVNFAPFRDGSRHHVFSVTKSISSALIGIAIEQGYIESVDTPVLDFFPDYEFENMDEDKAAITLYDLLTMSDGMEWYEIGVPYVASQNTTTQLWQFDEDWVQFILDQPMVAEPGTQWNYNSGSSHLLSAIIEETTGMNASDFADLNLFGPLGISTIWSGETRGRTIGAWGLNIRPQDMAKIGYLYLHNGRWEDEQILPEAWVEASTTAQVVNYYGYQWWLVNGGFMARGRAGQYIAVYPEQDLIVVMTSSFSDAQSFRAEFFLNQNILPAVVLDDEALGQNPAANARLQQEIEGAESGAPVLSRSAAGIIDQTFELGDNSLGWHSISLRVEGDRTLLTINGSEPIATSSSQVILSRDEAASFGLEGEFSVQANWTDTGYALRVQQIFPPRTLEIGVRPAEDGGNREVFSSR